MYGAPTHVRFSPKSDRESGHWSGLKMKLLALWLLNNSICPASDEYQVRETVENQSFLGETNYSVRKNSIGDRSCCNRTIRVAINLQMARALGIEVRQRHSQSPTRCLNRMLFCCVA